MRVGRKLFLVFGLLYIFLIFCSCSNNSIIDDKTGPGIDPKITTINNLSIYTKETFYPECVLRFFNPINSVNNLEIDKLEKDDCLWTSYDVQKYYIYNGNNVNLPAYQCGNCGLNNNYFNAVYKNIITLDVIQLLYPTCDSFIYELQGFSFDICIKQDDSILATTAPSFSTINLGYSGGIGGPIKADLEGFVEGDYIFFGNNYSFLNKMSKYQAEGDYKGLIYKTCTTIHPAEAKKQSICIKNIIRIDETINDYVFSYYVCDMSFLTLNNVEENELFTEKIMDPILTPLRAKTIDMAQSFIDHSLDYLSE